MNHEFRGFPEGFLRFLEELRANNDKGWFDAHRGEYDELVLDPSRQLVLALGERLRGLAPGVHADPRVNRSLFRIHRDTRFSTDKRPYKTNVGIWLWEGEGPQMANSGFYTHLEPDHIMFGVGMYQFPKELLEPYRETVVHARTGASLQAAIAAVKEAGNYTIGGERYKRVPRGHDAEHPNAALLRHGGLYAGVEMLPPAELRSEAFVELAYRHFERMYPLHEWLRDHIPSLG